MSERNGLLKWNVLGTKVVQSGAPKTFFASEFAYSKQLAEDGERIWAQTSCCFGVLAGMPEIPNDVLLNIWELFWSSRHSARSDRCPKIDLKTWLTLSLVNKDKAKGLAKR